MPFPTHTEVKQPPLFSGFTWIGRTKLCSLSNMTALLGQPFIIDNVNVMSLAEQPACEKWEYYHPMMSWRQLWWSGLCVTILDLKPQNHWVSPLRPILNTKSVLLMKVNVCEKHQLCMAFSKPHQLTTSLVLSQKGSSFCFFGKAENTFIIFYRVSDL